MVVAADTGFWVALADRKDRFHARALGAYDALTEPLITTWPVMSESCYLMLTHLGTNAQITFMRSCVQGAFKVFELGPTHVPRMQSLMEDYADLPMDLADASLVVLAEHLGHGRILSTDVRDFQTYRWENHRPFENLLAAE